MNGFHGQDAEEIFRSFFGGQDPFSMFFQEGMQGGGGRGGPFGSRVHVSHFGPGFTFTSFGGHPHMRARHFQNRQQQQQQQQQRQ
jgi:DnaJ family protein B protein 6